MQHWWQALEQLSGLLQDSDALGLSREARRRLIAAIGAVDNALLDCARADCPIQSAVEDSHAAGERTTPAPEASSSVESVQVQAGATVHSCRTCRWWNQDRRDVAAGEGACVLTRTEAGETDVPHPVLANTLARATAAAAGIGAVLITQVPYACSQWMPL